jgi:A/G-specific adenine glycosylase
MDREETEKADGMNRKERSNRNGQAGGQTDSAMTPHQDQKERFVQPLLEWYRRHKRDLPWRRSRDPYHIWVSEVMLQQTRVETVIPYYERFLERFPTLEALAQAPEEEVLKLWEGLGYYSRARNLQSAVREVCERYGGVVPDTPEQISSLKGVGPYTAGAILSIAYGRPEPAVDGNVMRVLSRFFLIVDDIAKPSTRTRMEELVRGMIPQDAPGDFTQALMELGALVCTPRTPHCLICPVMEHCAARLEGMETALPMKKKAAPPRPEYRAAAVVKDRGGRILIRRRPAGGLLAGMWELPHIWLEDEQRELPDTWKMEFLRDALAGEGIRVEPLRRIGREEHVFSHIHWHMDVFEFSAEGDFSREAPLPSPYRYLEAEGGMDELAFPNIFLRILRQIYT